MMIKKISVILLITLLVLFFYQYNKQESPIPITPEEEITDFENWFERHHPSCEICIPGWPPLMCEEAWQKRDKQRRE